MGLFLCEGWEVGEVKGPLAATPRELPSCNAERPEPGPEPLHCPHSAAGVSLGEVGWERDGNQDRALGGSEAPQKPAKNK